MEYPEQLNNFCNYMSHLNRSVLTIEQYRTDLTMFFQYLRAGRISKVPTKEELDRQPIADFSVEELRAITGEDVFRFLRYVSEERGNKPAARARKLSAIKSFFKYLVHVKELLDVNPAAAINTPKMDKRLPSTSVWRKAWSFLKAWRMTRNPKTGNGIIAYLRCFSTAVCG